MSASTASLMDLPHARASDRFPLRPLHHDRAHALVNVWSTGECGFTHIWVRLHTLKSDQTRGNELCLQRLIG
jgi:hypothetical protein